MKTILIALLISTGTFANAEVIIYRHGITMTTEGNFSRQRSSLGGYTVFEYDSTGTIAVLRIVSNAKAKTFFVSGPAWEEWELDEISPSATRASSLVYTEAREWIETDGKRSLDNYVVKGTTSLVNVGTDTARIPRSWRFTGKSVYSDSSGERFFEDSTGTLSLDLSLTKAANTAGDNIDSAIDRVITILQSRGYVEE